MFSSSLRGLSLFNLSFRTIRMASSAPKQFKVFVTQPIPKAASDLLEENGVRMVVNEKSLLTSDDLIENIKDCDGLFCTLNEKIDKKVLSHVDKSRFKVIATCSVGYDHIDLNECARLDIPVGYTPGVLTDATAEFTVGLLLNTSRRISESINSLKNGEWSSWKIMWMCGQGLANSTVGIFGLGRIGFAVAKRLQNFGVKKFIYHNRNRNTDAETELPNCSLVSMDQLLAESDFLICTCASTPQTNQLFDKNIFAKMKKTAIFINVSRGNVVNQNDLYDALESGTILAAGLDVCTPEPLPLDNKLLKLKNCIITPHICSSEWSTRTNMSLITATNLINGLNEKPLVHQVNKS